jgi:hypothetical protein
MCQDRDRILYLLDRLRPLEEKKNRIGFEISKIRHEISIIRHKLEQESMKGAGVCRLPSRKGESHAKPSRDTKSELAKLAKKLGKDEILKLISQL